MPYITFDHDKAQQALTEFLSGDEEGRESTGRRMSRNISTPDGKDLAAVIVDPANLEELEDQARAWREHMEPKGDTDLPPGYRPYQHAPTAREDRLLPIEPLEKSLAEVFLGKDLADLDREEKSKVMCAAILCVLGTTLDPDDTGAVPILMHAHDPSDRDAPQARKLWQLAYKTSVHGLYVRATANGFFGEEFGIVTGGGFRLASGWWDRAAADKAVAAIGQVLPQVDWMGLQDASVFTPEALAALKQVFTRYRFMGEDEAAPLPEPITETPDAPADMDDVDDGTCGDCETGRCHGTGPGECGCARHEASVSDDA